MAVLSKRWRRECPDMSIKLGFHPPSFPHVQQPQSSALDISCSNSSFLQSHHVIFREQIPRFFSCRPVQHVQDWEATSAWTKACQIWSWASTRSRSCETKGSVFEMLGSSNSCKLFFLTIELFNSSRLCSVHATISVSLANSWLSTHIKGIRWHSRHVYEQAHQMQVCLNSVRPSSLEIC